MLRAGDLVIADFPGAQGKKRRPAIVVSTDTYHRTRPDLIVGLLTTNVMAATTPTDHFIRDWKSAGLHQPSAFRAYFAMILQNAVSVIGHVSDADWVAIQSCIRRAIQC